MRPMAKLKLSWISGAGGLAKARQRRRARAKNIIPELQRASRKRKGKEHPNDDDFRLGHLLLIVKNSAANKTEADVDASFAGPEQTQMRFARPALS